MLVDDNRVKINSAIVDIQYTVVCIIPDIVLAHFVDAEVGEVHAEVVQFHPSPGIADRGETSKTLLVEVDPQGVKGGHCNIQPQIKLEAWRININMMAVYMYLLNTLHVPAS